MKSLNLFLLYGWLSTLAISCKKNDFIPVDTGCILEGQEVKKVKNKTGTLAYYEVNSGDNAHMVGYFILNHNVSEVGHLPIRVCNFPKTEFPDIKHGDQVPIDFKGTIVILSDLVDALNTDIELSGIKKAK